MGMHNRLGVVKTESVEVGERAQSVMFYFIVKFSR